MTFHSKLYFAAGIKTHTEVFPMADANAASLALKQDAFKGTGVLAIDS